jgi:hypothetical protein
VRAKVPARWLLLLGLAACATLPAGQIPALAVRGLSLTFLEPGAGQLRFSVPASCAQSASVSWKLGLDGRDFAAGVESAPRQAAALLEIDTPLSWRHLGWRDGARYARLRLTGEVRCDTLNLPQPFSGEAEVLVEGGPVLDAPRD